MTIGNQIKRARTARGFTQDQLAGHLKISRVSVAQWEGRGNSPEPSKLPRIAEFLGVPVDWLLGDSSDLPAMGEPLVAPAEPERVRTKGQPINFVPGDEVVIPGRRNLLPVFSGAMGGNGKLIVSSDFVDHVDMPAALAGVKGAYGLIVDGSSMVPEFWEGDVAWVNPHLKPARGRNHIFYHTPPGGEDAEAIIKRLNGWNDREWDLEQWNPALKFQESRKTWPICHRVVGKYEAP